MFMSMCPPRKMHCGPCIAAYTQQHLQTEMSFTEKHTHASKTLQRTHVIHTSLSMQIKWTSNYLIHKHKECDA